MSNDELHDLASTVVINGVPRDFNNNPLSMEEMAALLDFCRQQICNGDLDHGYKMFYSKVFDILKYEFKKGLN